MPKRAKPVLWASFRTALRLLLTVMLGASVGGVVNASPWPHEKQRVLRALESVKVEERRRAALDLGILSTSLLRVGLLKALSDSDLMVRISSGRVVLASDERGFSSQIRPWMKSQELQERILATEILGREPDLEDLTVLSRALSDRDRGLRRLAVIGLGRAPSRYHSEATAWLLGALADREPRVRMEVVASLGRVGDLSAVVPLAAQLHDPDWRVRAQTALALGVIGESAVGPALVVALGDEQEEVVAPAAEAIGRLGLEEAVPSLISLCRQSPLLTSGKHALHSLVTIGGDLALGELLRQVERPEARSLVLSALERNRDLGEELLRKCVEQSTEETLKQCSSTLITMGYDTEPLFEAYAENRMRAKDLLSLLAGVRLESATVLALEMLGDPGQKERNSALDYLSSLLEISGEAWGPVTTALNGGDWSSLQVARLLRILALTAVKPTKGGRALGWLYLDASRADVRAAAAALLVSQGVCGEEFEELILNARSEVAAAALRQLSLETSRSQAMAVVNLLGRGLSGQRKLLLSTLWSFPSGLPASSRAVLESLWSQARGGVRDGILNAFLRNGDASQLLRLFSQGDRGDQMKLAQLAWYHPHGGALAEKLVREGHDRTVALALPALGLRGDSSALPLVLSLAKGEGERRRPHYLRVAAFQALRLFYQRKVILELPEGLITEDICTSKHVPLRVAALRLAATAEVSCPLTRMVDVLLLERDARVRLVAAELLRDGNPESQALRRCIAYEPRLLVAQACKGEDIVSSQKQGILPDSGEERPFRLVTFESWRNSQPRYLTPVVLQSRGFYRVLASDRRGKVLVPAGEFKLLSEYMGY